MRFGDIEAEDLVDENGMVRDGYDYSQHMKEMGQGHFYSANGRFESRNELARRVELPEDVLPSGEEHERLLEAITLTTEVMDDDLREALTNDEAFEELDDDFAVQAATQDDSNAEADGFDYDAHIARLMEAASGLVPKYRGNLTDDEDDDDNDDEFLTDNEDADLDRQVLDELFEKTLAEEYDDDMLGELEEDDPDVRGHVELEGALLDSIVEDFVTVRLEMLNDEGKIGNPLRTGNRLQQVLAQCEAERVAFEEADTVEGEEEGDANKEEEARDLFPVPEDNDVDADLEKMMERSVYMQPREREQWDCETIVSTYSNLDNHPTVIREEPRRPKKTRKPKPLGLADDAFGSAMGGGARPIQLSRKTGMPLGVLEAKRLEEATTTDKENKKQQVPQLAKARGESKEDKKARKEAVKQLKRERRTEKKEVKTAFKEEEQRMVRVQGQQQSAANGAKLSVFKY